MTASTTKKLVWLAILIGVIGFVHDYGFDRLKHDILVRYQATKNLVGYSNTPKVQTQKKQGLPLASSYTLHMVEEDALKLNVQNLPIYRVTENSPEQITLTCEMQIGSVFWRGYTYKCRVSFDPLSGTGDHEIRDPRAKVPYQTGTVSVKKGVRRGTFDIRFAYDDQPGKSCRGTFVPN
jgi:hypothetical protein